MTKLGICLVDGCKEPAEYFIGSLEREIKGEKKWLYVCKKHEEEIARENSHINAEAALRGLTLAEYVEELKGGKGVKADADKARKGASKTGKSGR